MENESLRNQCNNATSVGIQSLGKQVDTRNIIVIYFIRARKMNTILFIKILSNKKTFTYHHQS